MASRAVTKLYDHFLNPAGLTASQYTILVGIAAYGPVTIGLLARGLVMDRTTLLRTMRPLLHKGFVADVTGENQRARTFEITDVGLETLGIAFPLWQQAQDHLVAHLGMRTWERLQAALENVTDVPDLR